MLFIHGTGCGINLIKLIPHLVPCYLIKLIPHPVPCVNSTAEMRVHKVQWPRDRNPRYPGRGGEIKTWLSHSPTLVHNTLAFGFEPLAACRCLNRVRAPTELQLIRAGRKEPRGRPRSFCGHAFPLCYLQVNSASGSVYK